MRKSTVRSVRNVLAVIGTAVVLGPAQAGGELLRLQAASEAGTPPAEVQPLQLLPPDPAALSSAVPLWPEAQDPVYSAAQQATEWERTGTSVTVLTAEELRQRGVRTVAEALQGVPGLDVVASGGAGQIASAFIRGTGSTHTLLLWNGVELNDPSYPGRGADLSKLSVDDLERIEIVRGPQGAVYGSGAMGGVVNLITRPPARAWEGSARVELGTRETTLGAASAAGGVGPVDAGLGVSYLSTRGYSAAKRELTYAEPQSAMLPNPYRNLTADLGLGLQALENLSLRLDSRYITGRVSLDHGGGDFADTEDYDQDFIQSVNRLLTAWILWGGRWRQTLNLGLAHWVRTTSDRPGDPLPTVASDYRARAYSLDWRNQLKDIVVGLNLRHELGRYTDETGLLYGGSVSNFPERSGRRLGLYLEGRYQQDRLSVDAGVRWDLHDRFGSATTFRITPVYLVPVTGTRLKGTYGTGFNAPALDQLYSEYGDPDLKPETTTGWDLGLEQDLGLPGWQGGVTYFRNDLKNLVQSDPSTWRYRNLGLAQTQGWEAFFAAAVRPELNARFTYTKLTANDITNLDTTGPIPLLRRADHQAALDLSSRLGDADLSAGVTYVGPRWDLDPNSYARITLPAHTVLRLSAAYAVLPGHELSARVNNLLDADYEEVAGYTAPRFECFAGYQVRFR